MALRMQTLHIVRVLLDSLPSIEETEEVEADLKGESKGERDHTQTLRIVSVFVILAAGLIGGLPPLFLKFFRDPDSMLTRLVRAFAAGVIAALALVHIIPEAVTEMEGLGGVEYPLGGTCALGGIALMIFLEHMGHIMHNGSSTSGLITPHKVKQPSCVPSQALCTVSVEDQSRGPAVAVGVLKQQPVYPSDNAAEASTGHGHSHVCVSRGSASNWLTAGAMEAVGSIRLKVVAYLFELGCIFHSFIIGISLGVNQTDVKEVRSLLIALAFHQWLEGISLASVILRGGFSVVKGGLMILTYSLTCPVGIAVGMAIAETYDPDSTRSRGVQGAFNGVSGGMLLYIALVQLVAEDMGRLVPGRDSAKGRLVCFAALCGGAASMCLLAIWA